MPLYRPLAELTLADVAQYGGKAARLGDALHLGCPVLPGVVLSTEFYRRFMRQGGLQGEVASIMATMQPTAMTHFQAVEWAIRSAFAVRRMPEQVTAAIIEAFQALGGVPVAVRSSATAEDSPEQSFVGQHLTCLDVSSEDAVLQAVLDCWQSLFSAKALSYARRFHVDLLNASMAVVLQPMIRTVSQGSLSTVDPITGNADTFVLEISEGPMVGVYWLDPYVRQPGELHFWSRLRHLGLLLDEHYLAYQSIEWAITEDEELYFLRVRPSTGIQPYLPESRSFIAVGAGPFELARRPNSTARATPPFSWYHRSRSPRLNAAYSEGVSRLFTRRLERGEFYPSGYLYARGRGYARPNVGEHGPVRRVVHSLRCLQAARSLDQEFRRLLREAGPRLEALSATDIGALTDAELATHLQEMVRLGEAFWREYGRLENVPEVLRQILCSLHRRWLDRTGDCSILLWSPDDQIAQCEVGLSELARRSFADAAAREEAFDALYRRYRHLFTKGQPLCDWQDLCGVEGDPAKARALMETWAQGGVPLLADQNAARLAQRTAAEENALARLGGLRGRIYLHVLRLARRYAPLATDREAPVRQCRLLESEAVREVGRRLVSQGLASAAADGSLLGYREILDWLTGAVQQDELVRSLLQRRDLRRRWWRYAPPDILTTSSARPPSAAMADTEGAEVILRGQAVSPGSVQGRARIVRTLGEATNVVPGEVLVCPEPLFELSPLFSLVAAVATEGGRLLGHAGVLVREYGVPAVFGVEGATRTVRTGDALHVDANQGLIMRLPPGTG